MTGWFAVTLMMRVTGAVSQLSTTSAKMVTLTILWFSGQMFNGVAVRLRIVGGVVSLTVTVNEPVAVLPCASVELQFTVVVPRLNVEPLGGVQTTGSVTSTRSVAVAVYVTTAVQPAPAETVTGGRLSVGGVVSRTVTWNVAVPMLPRESVAWHVTNVVPSPNVEPLAGEQTAGRGPSALSDAEAVNITTAPLGL